MTGKNYVSIVVMLMVMVAATAALAGTIQLPRTGQTSCYSETGALLPSCDGTGQDGNKQMGVVCPHPRFSGSGDCVTDNLTGLMWSRNGNLAGTRTWQGALDWVDSLNSGGGLCGYTDWRLPNRKELKSLVNRQQANSASWLNGQGFNSVQAYNYWSSSTYADYTYDAWYVGMSDGRVSSNGKTNGNYYVWPVRSGQSGNLVP